MALRETSTGSAFRVGAMFLFVAAFAAAGAGLLVQHRKLDELRRERKSQQVVLSKLTGDHQSLVSANERLTDELRKMRDAIRVCEKERDALRRERGKLSGQKAQAQAASRRAESLAKDLAAAKSENKKLAESVKSLTASVGKLRKENEALENELNGAMAPAEEDTTPPSQKNADDIMLLPAPPPDKLTPKEREAHNRAELEDLIGL